MCPAHVLENSVGLWAHKLFCWHSHVAQQCGIATCGRLASAEAVFQPEVLVTSTMAGRADLHGGQAAALLHSH
jgi:hypothetical protein